MTYLRDLLADELRDESGATLVEYALLLAFFGLFAIAALTTLSSAINSLLIFVGGALTGGQTGS
ncbi:MAG TPA: Flp family type IVb pilin [Candidatus Baltobacteraceae bacterium]|nr:Flp family type IVb pilin [Candidatus Baltobacteraceae bacterium]